MTQQKGKTMSYTENDPRNYLDGQHATTAEEVEAEADPGFRPRSGSERVLAEERVDPARFLAKDERSVAETGTRGRRTPGSFVHSDGTSNLHNRAREAARRPEGHAVGEVPAVAQAWADVLAAVESADEAVREIPESIVVCRERRAKALAEADGPVTLPNEADTRAYSEARAHAALHHAIAERAHYDRVVIESRDETSESLSASVPKRAAAIGKRVKDLQQEVEGLREAVDAQLDAALRAAKPGHGRARMPRAATLSTLDALEVEVRELIAVSENPTVPIVEPSLQQREAIAQQMRGAVSPPPAVVELAKIERAENYRYSSWTRGIPLEVLKDQSPRWIS